MWHAANAGAGTLGHCLIAVRARRARGCFAPSRDPEVLLQAGENLRKIRNTNPNIQREVARLADPYRRWREPAQARQQREQYFLCIRIHNSQRLQPLVVAEPGLWPRKVK